MSDKKKNPARCIHIKCTMLNYGIGNFHAEFTTVSVLKQRKRKKCELQIYAQRNIMHETCIFPRFFAHNVTYIFENFLWTSVKKMPLLWIDKDYFRMIWLYMWRSKVFGLRVCASVLFFVCAIHNFSIHFFISVFLFHANFFRYRKWNLWKTGIHYNWQ